MTSFEPLAAFGASHDLVELRKFLLDQRWVRRVVNNNDTHDCPKINDRSVHFWHLSHSTMMIKVSCFRAEPALVLFNLFLLNQFYLTLLTLLAHSASIRVRWGQMVERTFRFDAVDIEDDMLRLPLTKPDGCRHGLVEHIGKQVCCRRITVGALCQYSRHGFNSFLEKLYRF